MYTNASPWWKHGYDKTDEGSTENIAVVENNVNDKIDLWLHLYFTFWNILILLPNFIEIFGWNDI